MLNKLKELMDKNKSRVIGYTLAAGLIGLFTYKLNTKQLIVNSPAKASVMITNRAGTSGGTGIILESTQNQSSILTNKHVCGVVKKGGAVRTLNGVYQVVSYLESDRSDLCLISIADDLGVRTNIANRPPSMYDHAKISGHPALMPNVISEGHVSGRRIIDVFVGMKPCTEEEQSSELGLICLIFGGMPIIQSFESTLITATIMPGSSGSGIYNSDNELIGVVFAGQGDLGYAWTVPYEQVLNFLYRDHQNLKTVLIDQSISLKDSLTGDQKDWRQALKEVKAKCAAGGNVDPNFSKVCSFLRTDDLIWVK